MNKNPTIVNPTFRLDVTGKLFKNKATNINPQETLIFNDLMTRLSIYKGDLALFPELGLKQHLEKFNFGGESDIAKAVEEFEEDVFAQMKRNCTIDFKLDKENKNTLLKFNLEGLTYDLNYKYNSKNNSIRVINYSFENN